MFHSNLYMLCLFAWCSEGKIQPWEEATCRVEQAGEPLAFPKGESGATENLSGLLQGMWDSTMLLEILARPAVPSPSTEAGGNVSPSHYCCICKSNKLLLKH